VKGLLALDLDGVLLQDDSTWGLFHSIMGTDEGRTRNMRSFFSGSVDYVTWARMDAELWRGKDFSVVAGRLEDLSLTPGARELVSVIRSMGVSIAIISTGISAVAERVGRILGIGNIVANDVEIADGRITGKVRINCGFDEKGSVLKRLARDMGIPLESCASVGDDINDIPMFRVVPFSVAFNPKGEEVARSATVAVRADDLTPVLAVLRRHFEELA